MIDLEKRMNLERVLLWLYHNEINCEIGSFWDGGWWVRLGDPMNGYKDKAENFYDLQSVADWLQETALRYYSNMETVSNA